MVVVCDLDLDAKGDESPVDGEKSHILAQWPQLPALEGKVSIGFLKQHKRLEGGHPDGNPAFFLLVQDIREPVQPPLLPWIKDLFQYLTTGSLDLFREVPSSSQRATWGVSKKITLSGSVTDTPTGGLVNCSSLSISDVFGG